jgi:hypothetical protein
MNTTMDPPAVGYRPFAAMSIVWLAAAYLAGQYVAVLPFGFVVVSVFIFAVPIAISGAYSSAINQTRMMSYYKTSGWFYKIFSRRIIRSTLWVIWALGSSFVMLLQFSTYSGLEWVTLALAIPVFWYVHKIFKRVFSSELKKRYVISSFAITWARLICPLILIFIYAILASMFAAGKSYTSLAEAVAVTRVNTPEVAGSAVVQVALFFVSFVDGTKAYLGSNLHQFGDHVPLFLIILGSYMVFFNASATFASFAIPRSEHRRIFGPISDDETPPTLTRTRGAIASALVTVVTLFIYVPVFAGLEDAARANPGLIERLKNAQLKVEKIDDEFYRPGTMKAIELAKTAALGKKIAVARTLVEGQIDRAFGQMESNVDGYLDWYYSLTGEYTRLAKLMTGDIEKYMEEKLVEKLKQQEALQSVFAGLEVALAASQKAVDDVYQEDFRKILAENRLQVPEFGSRNIPGIASAQIRALPTHPDVIAMRSRVVGGAAAAGISAAIVGKIVSKAIFKAAAKTLSKVAMSKAAGTAGGAVIGAAIGSVVPGIGTLIGAAAGGIIAGVIVDKGLLKLEEAISREDFKKEILGSIRESRDKFKSELFGAP